MLDAQASQVVDWNVQFQRMRQGLPLLLRLDYLETTRQFLVFAYETMNHALLQQIQLVASDRVRVYTTDEKHLPDELVNGLILGKVVRQELAQSPHFLEASLQMALWVELTPVVVVAELEGKQIRELGAEMSLSLEDGMLSVKDIVHRKMSEIEIVEFSARVTVPTKWGDFEMIAFTDSFGTSHSAIMYGDITEDEPVLLRVHSECFTGDIFGSGRCDCGEQLDYAMQQIQETGRGVVLYLRQEGRGIGLVNKLNAYMLQDAGYDTVEANHHLGFPGDARDYTFTLQMMKHLGIDKIRLLTNNPRKWAGLGEFGVEVVERVPVHITPGAHNHQYLQTKSHKLGHRMEHLVRE